MRIVIDMQGAQSTGSRLRGIGRYTLSLVQEIIRMRSRHEIVLALNGLFPDTIEPIRAGFEQWLPPENIRIWQAPGPVCSLNKENIWRQHAAELIREAFLASLKPDIVLVTSLFEGLSDDAVTSIGTLSDTLPTVSMLYDLIPLIYRRPYLENPVVEAWYEEKLNHLRRANLLLAISESSRQESIRYLDYPPTAVVNISSAADPQFRSLPISEEQQALIRERYRLLRPFVMYTGGIDHRKNIEGLIRAYAGLPAKLRASHQLAIICSVQPASRAMLEDLSMRQGLQADELVLTGFVPEEDLIALYNLCEVFVFPSWHEGFGLPALEAMSCGCAVIGADTSSVPEVIGRDDALFDPTHDAAISAKLEQVLTNDAFRAELEVHGLEQAKRFSWEISAKLTIDALEAWHTRQAGPARTVSCSRLKLAYLSPLPPERSGISDYSAELLPVLAAYYDIEVIVAQQMVSDPWIEANCPVRSVEWFEQNGANYDRVLYQFGNSQFHTHMFRLLRQHPGVVMLHDFFLSGVLAHEELGGALPRAWTTALRQSHGYAAWQERQQATDTAGLVWRYPCNLEVLQKSLGVIVHSENTRLLARQWYGRRAAADWAVIPHLRVPAQACDRARARAALNLRREDFVVCSFGLLAPTKLNHRLLNAWLTSALAQDENCLLVFVGENHSGDYGRQLLKAIEQSGLSQRIRITGWADTAIFRTYLAAADIGVQLRTLSRGETSGTVLDCMNHGLATIINANGSMADYPEDAVWMLADEFTDAALAEALEILWRDDKRRSHLATRAGRVVRTRHDPAACAEQYAQAIEAIYRCAATGRHALVKAIGALEDPPTDDAALGLVAQALATTCLPSPLVPQLLVDVSGMVQANRQASVEQLLALIQAPPDGFRVEPVYLTDQDGEWHYRYARSYTCQLLGIESGNLPDAPIDLGPDDILGTLDFSPGSTIEAARSELQSEWKSAGLLIRHYDLSCENLAKVTI